eukprot:m.579 g.579  ORF g.579 m.579 type:complete len:91 (-) comp132_c0_seq1:188-460(-)
MAHGVDLTDISAGRHAWSADGMHWTTSAVAPYGPFIKRSLPPWSTLLARRERPKLVLDVLGRPTYLINGVQRVEDLADGRSHTMVHPVCG